MSGGCESIDCLRVSQSHFHRSREREIRQKDFIASRINGILSTSWIQGTFLHYSLSTWTCQKNVGGWIACTYWCGDDVSHVEDTIDLWFEGERERSFGRCVRARVPATEVWQCDHVRVTTMLIRVRKNDKGWFSGPCKYGFLRREKRKRTHWVFSLPFFSARRKNTI